MNISSIKKKRLIPTEGVQKCQPITIWWCLQDSLKLSDSGYAKRNIQVPLMTLIKFSVSEWKKPAGSMTNYKKIFRPTMKSSSKDRLSGVCYGVNNFTIMTLPNG